MCEYGASDRKEPLLNQRLLHGLLVGDAVPLALVVPCSPHQQQQQTHQRRALRPRAWCASLPTTPARSSRPSAASLQLTRGVELGEASPVLVRLSLRREVGSAAKHAITHMAPCTQRIAHGRCAAPARTCACSSAKQVTSRSSKFLQAAASFGFARLHPSKPLMKALQRRLHASFSSGVNALLCAPPPNGHQPHAISARGEEHLRTPEREERTSGRLRWLLLSLLALLLCSAFQLCALLLWP